jgi:hypothetical protein
LVGLRPADRDQQPGRSGDDVGEVEGPFARPHGGGVTGRADVRAGPRKPFSRSACESGWGDFGNFIPKCVPLGLAFLLPDDDSQNPETRRPPVAVLQQWGDGAAAPQAGARGAAAFSVGR